MGVTVVVGLGVVVVVVVLFGPGMKNSSRTGPAVISKRAAIGSKEGSFLNGTNKNIVFYDRHKLRYRLFFRTSFSLVSLEISLKIWPSKLLDLSRLFLSSFFLLFPSSSLSQSLFHFPSSPHVWSVISLQTSSFSKTFSRSCCCCGRGSQISHISSINIILITWRIVLAKSIWFPF